LHIATDRLREGRAEVGVFGVDVTVAEAGRDVGVYAPVDVDFDAAVELITVTTDDVHVIAGARGKFDGIRDRHVEALDVVATDREVQAIIEERALDAVVFALRGFGFVFRARDVDRVVGLVDEVAFAVVGVDAEARGDLVERADVGLGLVNFAFDDDRSGRRALDAVDGREVVTLVEADGVIARTEVGQEAVVDPMRLLTELTASNRGPATGETGELLLAPLEVLREVGERSGGREVRGEVKTRPEPAMFQASRSGLLTGLGLAAVGAT